MNLCMYGVRTFVHTFLCTGSTMAAQTPNSTSFAVQPENEQVDSSFCTWLNTSNLRTRHLPAWSAYWYMVRRGQLMAPCVQPGPPQQGRIQEVPLVRRLAALPRSRRLSATPRGGSVWTRLVGLKKDLGF